MIRFTSDIKFNVYLDFKVQGVVQVSDVIGALIMQSTQKGGKFSISKLQSNQRIGKIEVVHLKTTQSPKTFTTGTVIIPCDWDRKNISLFCSFMEQVLKKIKIYDCKVVLSKIEACYRSSSSKVIKRALEIYHRYFDSSQESDFDTIDQSFDQLINAKNASNYGSFIVGPGFLDHKNVIVVQGRADVMNLSKKGIGNTLGVNGINFNGEELSQVLKDKIVTVFVDGDSGGLAVKKKLAEHIEISHHIDTPSNMKVQELQREQIYELIRQRMPFDKSLL